MAEGKKKYHNEGKLLTRENLPDAVNIILSGISYPHNPCISREDIKQLVALYLLEKYEGDWYNKAIFYGRLGVIKLLNAKQPKFENDVSLGAVRPDWVSSNKDGPSWWNDIEELMDYREEIFEARELADEWWAKLTEKERDVVLRRLRGQIFEEIAEDYGVSKVRAGQIAKQAERKFRKILERETQEDD